MQTTYGASTQGHKRIICKENASDLLYENLQQKTHPVLTILYRRGQMAMYSFATSKSLLPVSYSISTHTVLLVSYVASQTIGLNQ